MIEITGPLQKEAWLTRTMPPVEQLAPLAWSIPIEATEYPIRYTLCYLLANEAGQFVLIDPGTESDEGMDQLKAGIAQAGLSTDGLLGIVVTHFHPDHLGMVHSLIEGRDVWIAMHRDEIPRVEAMQRFGQEGADDEAWLLSCGVPADEVASISRRMRHQELRFVPELPTMLLEDGATVPLPGRDVRVILTPGHTAGHLCVVDSDSRLIFTGDHILPRITPNVGADFHDEDRDPVAEYYVSLEKVKPWDDCEVCPGHEYRIRGLAQRCEDLAGHQRARSEEVAALIAAGAKNPWEVAQRLIWSRGWDSLDGFNRRSALGEAFAHYKHVVGSPA